MDVTARNRAQQISMSAVVTRADGTVENLGTIAFWDRNPLVRFRHNAFRFLATGRRGRITTGQ